MQLYNIRLHSQNNHGIEGQQETTDKTLMANCESSLSKIEATASTTRCPQKIFHYPVTACNHPGFTTNCGCQKHVAQRHSWWFFFKEKSNAREIFSGKMITTRPDRNWHWKPRASTSTMSSFNVTSRFGNYFLHSVSSNWVGSRRSGQATQIVRRVLKFLCFCYPDTDSTAVWVQIGIKHSYNIHRHIFHAHIKCLRSDEMSGTWRGGVIWVVCRESE